MRGPLPALLTLCLLAGCNGYALDYTVPKSRLVAPQLARFGLDAAQGQCITRTLSGRLSVWQTRQLADAAAAATFGEGVNAPMTVRELVAASRTIEDGKVAEEVARAVGSCGLAAQTRAEEPSPPRAEKPPVAEVPPPAAPAERALPPVEGAEGKIENGPPGYQPSQELLTALDAYDRADFASAAAWAQSAADKGDSGAQQFLGGLFAFGRGVPVDHKLAVTYYRMAAEQGWSEAMNNLGNAHEIGEGVERDPVEALKWYLVAYNRATEDADLVARNMANLLRNMTDAQIQEAQRLEQEWEEAHPR